MSQDHATEPTKSTFEEALAEVPSIFPSGSKQFTVFISFYIDEEAAEDVGFALNGQSAIQVSAVDVPTAIMAAQRRVYLDTVEDAGIPGELLNVEADMVVPGWIRPLWVAGDGIHHENEPDGATQHDPAVYDPARDPYFQQPGLRIRKKS